MVQTELCYRCLTYFHRASRWISVYKKITLRGTRRHTVDTVDFPRRSFHGGVNKTHVAYCISPKLGLLFEETRIPFTQACFVPSFVEIGPLVLEKNIFKMYQCIFAISPLWKGQDPSFEQIWTPLHLRILCAKFGWNWPNGSGEEEEKVKSLQQQRLLTTDKLCDQKSSLEPLA